MSVIMLVYVGLRTNAQLVNCFAYFIFQFLPYCVMSIEAVLHTLAHFDTVWPVNRVYNNNCRVQRMTFQSSSSTAAAAASPSSVTTAAAVMAVTYPFSAGNM